ncbi:MAG: hypothetical protein DRJ38_10370 [Thermoprotei archaeon]|nr:MAG: hypothetical protein DRJ38_10370 [Thermoprotei archaeon]
MRISSSLSYRKAKLIARELTTTAINYSHLQAEEDARRISEKYALSYRDTLVFIRAFNRLKQKFPDKSESWFLRAAIRVVIGIIKIGNYRWKVPGVKELGDAYTWYLVVYDGKSKTYICDCFSRYGGTYRKYKICTHIAAVMAHRKMDNFLIEFIKSGEV